MANHLCYLLKRQSLKSVYLLDQSLAVLLRRKCHGDGVRRPWIMVIHPLLLFCLTHIVTTAFYYRVPGFVVATIALMLIQVPDQVVKPKFTVALRKAYHMLDTIGLFFVITFVVTLLCALQLGDKGWTNPRVIVLFVAAVLSGTVFAVWSVHRKERALFPASILKNRHVYYANLFGMATSGGMIPTSYFLPIFIQSVLGASPLTGALWLLPKTPIFIVVLILASVLSRFNWHCFEIHLVINVQTGQG